MKKHDPYENIIIGNFILTFGYVAAQTRKELNKITTQLLQHTPADKTYGDLLGAAGKKFFLIEFKRNMASIQTEHEKEKFTKIQDSKQEGLSKKCHFISWPHYCKEQKKGVLLISPYYETVKSMSKPESESELNLSDFFKKIMDNMDNKKDEFGLEEKDFLNYIKIFEENVGSQESGGGLSCLLMHISKEGEITTIVAESIQDLSLKLKAKPEKPDTDPEKPDTAPKNRIQPPKNRI